jgi:hypothetical protein
MESLAIGKIRMPLRPAERRHDWNRRPPPERCQTGIALPSFGQVAPKRSYRRRDSAGVDFGSGDGPGHTIRAISGYRSACLRSATSA